MRCISHQQGAATVVAEIDKNPVSKGMINIEQCRDTNTLMQSIESSGTNQDFFPFAFPFASQNTTCPQYWSRHIFSCFASKKVVAFLGFRLWIPHRAPYLVLPGSWLRCVLLAQEHVNNIVHFSYLRPLTDATEIWLRILSSGATKHRGLYPKKKQSCEAWSCNACSHIVWNNQGKVLFNCRRKWKPIAVSINACPCVGI